jgi:hypothetical protein
MTRLGLFSALVALPFASMGTARASAVESRDEAVTMFSPGTYSIATGGGIRIVGASHVSIEGCTFRSDGLASDASRS